MNLKELFAYIEGLSKRRQAALLANPNEIAVIAQEIIDNKRWRAKFKGQEFWDEHFNATNFPIGRETDEAEEFSFGYGITGNQALIEFDSMKREPASLAAQSRYLRANPDAQMEHPLLGIGAQWYVGDSIWIPLFHRDSMPFVHIVSIGSKYDQGFRFLIRKLV